MAQYTVALDPELTRPDGTCELRVRTQRGSYKTFVVRNGETVRTDDPVVAANLATLTANAGTRVLRALGTRPVNPTHDVDTKPDDTR